MAFDEKKYKDIFEQRHGKGSFDAGLSSARNIGATKAQADIAKDEYNKRLQEYKEKIEKKTYVDALDYWSDPANNSVLKKKGASRAAEEIRNDPMLQMQIKAQGYTIDDYVNALYSAASNGKFRSEREYNKFAEGLTKQVTAEEDDIYKKFGIQSPVTQGQVQKQGDLNIIKKQEKKQGDLSVMKKKDKNKDKEKGFIEKLEDLLPRKKADEKEDNWYINAHKWVDDKLFKPVEDKVGRFATNAADGLTLNQLKKNMKDKDNPEFLKEWSSAPTTKAEKATDFAGQMSGMALPVGAAYKVTGATAKSIAKAATKSGKLEDFIRALGLSKGIHVSNPAKVVEAAVSGAAAMGAYSTVREGVDEVIHPEDATLAQRASQVGLETALGFAGDPAVRALGPLIKSTPIGQKISSMMKSKKAPQVEEQLALPAPKETPKSVNSEPLGLPEPQLRLPEPNKVTPSSPNNLEPSFEPLMFKRPASSLDRLKPNREAITPSLERLKNITSGPSLQRVRAEQNKPVGEGFERLRNLNQSNPENLVNSFRSKVDRNPKETNKLKDFFSNFRTQFVDDLAPLKTLEKNIRGGISSAENSLYKQGRLFRGSSEKANQIVETKFSPILNNIKKAGYTADDLGDYSLAVHAKDVNAKGIQSGFSNEEINAVINKFKNPVMEQARTDLLNLNNSLLNQLADSGAIAKEAVQQLQKKHPNYMPLFRSFDDNKVEFSNGLQQSLANVSNPIKKLEGSGRHVIDPLESVVKNIFQLTNAADRNKVAGQLGKLAVEDTESLFIRQLSPGEEVGRKNVVSALENGQKVQYEVPSEVYKAMMNLDKESSNFLIKILQKPAGTLRAGATLTPEFSLRNPMKDVPQAFIVSNSGFNPLVDFPVGLFQSAMKGRSIKIAGKEFKTPDKMYRQFIEDNGGLGNIVSVDRNMHKQAIEEALKGKNKRFINVVNPKAWLGVLRAIADVSESATKVGEYRAALRSGASRQEAAYRARDIMDFARAGVSVREANKVVAFLNANIQGKSKLLRAVKENPLKVTMKSLQAITMPTVGVFLAQKYLASDEQKQLINDAPSWLKNTFWLIPVPGTEQVARIPKPYDLAPIFANLPERSLEYLANNDPAAFDNFARESFSSYAIPTMLTGLAPIIEGIANYSFFRDSPIIPKRESNLNYPEQYDVNTSETAKALGKGIDKLTGGTGTFKNFGSPRVVDNTIRGFTGGLGTYATDIIDLIVEGSGMVDEVERPEKDFLTEQTPLKAFLMNKNSTGKSVDKLYGLKDKLNRDRGSYQSKNEKFPNEAEFQFVNDVTKEISEISKAIRMVENDPNMSGEQKRQEIDKLNKLRNYLAYEVRRKMEAQK